MNIEKLYRCFCVALAVFVVSTVVLAAGQDLTARAQAQAKQSLDRIISAYESKNIREFSLMVSERYVGEKMVLEADVQRDFGRRNNLAIRYTVNNITMDEKSKVLIAVTFTRQWTDIGTSKTRSETKETLLTMILEDGLYRLYSQKKPLLFGPK